MLSRIVLCALSVASLAGCPSASCPVRRFDTASSALVAYRALRDPARVIRAEARVDRRDGEGRTRGTVLTFIERPDHVRFDVMTQFGPAMILTSDGATFALTDLRENRFHVGPTCPAHIERVIGLPLGGDEVAMLVLGEAPRIEAVREELACDGGVYRITLHDAAGRTQQLDFEIDQADLALPPAEQRTRLIRAEVRLPSGELEWRVTWGEHRVLEGPAGARVALPFRIRFEHPTRNIDTLVRFESIDLNAEVPSGAFVQEPRPGLEVETVECER